MYETKASTHRATTAGSSGRGGAGEDALGGEDEVVLEGGDGLEGGDDLEAEGGL